MNIRCCVLTSRWNDHTSNKKKNERQYSTSYFIIDFNNDWKNWNYKVGCWVLKLDVESLSWMLSSKVRLWILKFDVVCQSWFLAGIESIIIGAPTDSYFPCAEPNALIMTMQNLPMMRIVYGFFNVPHWTYRHGRYCETGPTVYCPYLIFK